jgi:hypothetical protein
VPYTDVGVEGDEERSEEFDWELQEVERNTGWGEVVEGDVIGEDARGETVEGLIGRFGVGDKEE